MRVIGVVIMVGDRYSYEWILNLLTKSFTSVLPPLFPGLMSLFPRCCVPTVPTSTPRATRACVRCTRLWRMDTGSWRAYCWPTGLIRHSPPMPARPAWLSVLTLRPWSWWRATWLTSRAGQASCGTSPALPDSSVSDSFMMEESADAEWMTNHSNNE